MKRLDSGGDGRLRVMRVIARMNVGGPALQVTGLVEELDAERFDHRLWTGSVGPDEADYIDLRAPSLPHTVVRGLGRSPKALDDVRALHALHAAMREFRPHVVHTHTAKAGVLGRAAARAAGVPVLVHTFHGHLLSGYFSPTVTAGVVQVERALARVSTRLVAVGAQVRDDLLAAGIGRPEQYAVVPPGIALPVPPSRAEARARLGLPPDVPVIVLVARLTGIKQPHRFLEVARRLADRHPAAVFAVVGEGELLPQLTLAAPDNVRFLGWRSDVEVVYAAADLAVLTSDNEGMPVSLIEAALCGVPAVATRVGSVAEVTLDERTGWLCPADVDALTAAVDRALSDATALRSAGMAAREHAVACFSRSRLVADTERLYETVAEDEGALVRIVVTGGAGFIGANLCRELSGRPEVREVVALDDLSTGSAANLEGTGAVLVQGSVLDRPLLAEVAAGASSIVHLAARPSVPRSLLDPVASHEVNATGTLYVLEAARSAGTHVVVASSSSVYGDTATLPKHEDLPTRPRSPYGVSKLATEGYALGHQASFGLPTLAFRFFNVYGPLQAAGHAYAAVVPAFVSAALRGEPVLVHGDGRQTRDFTYVGTVARVLADAVVGRVSSPVPTNLALGTRSSLLDLLATLEVVLGTSVAREHVDPRRGDVRDSQASCERLVALFPDVSAVPLERGLAETVAWFRRR